MIVKINQQRKRNIANELIVHLCLCFCIRSHLFHLRWKSGWYFFFCHACWSDKQNNQGVVITREILTPCVLIFTANPGCLAGCDIIEYTCGTLNSMWDWHGNGCQMIWLMLLECGQRGKFVTLLLQWLEMNRFDVVAAGTVICCCYCHGDVAVLLVFLDCRDFLWWMNHCERWRTVVDLVCCVVACHVCHRLLL